MSCEAFQWGRACVGEYNEAKKQSNTLFVKAYFMKIGISLPVRELQNDVGAIQAFAQLADELGFKIGSASCRERV